MEQSAPFEDTWSRYGQRPGLSRELVPLARELYDSLLSTPIDLARIEAATWAVLSFLASPAGRTDANCRAVDYFLCLGEFELPDLPNPLGDILADMAGALHDTVSSPDIAAICESTPEQLLARLRART